MHLPKLAPAALVAMLVAAPAAGAEKSVKEDHPAHGGPSAQAAPDGAAPAAATCGYSGTKVFAAWHDQRPYSLVPDGGFEAGGDGWTLADGAAVVEGNETAAVGGAADHQSLALPAGSSATSPSICVERRAGMLRLFARTDGSRKARLKVEVVYANGKKSKAAKLRAGDAWAPTRKLAVALGRAKSKGRLKTAAVSLRFTPVGEPAAWQVDDVYIDPRLRH